MKRHALYPEPGAWVLGKVQGLPEIQPPDGPIMKGLSAKAVCSLVEYHGLGFCIYSYIPTKQIKDEELRRLWMMARNALVDIVEYLDEADQPKKKAKRLRQGKNF